MDYGSVRVVLGWVAREAKINGDVAHVAMVFHVVVIKNEELPQDDPDRIKARSVLQGSIVKIEEGRYAIFDESSSTPSTMEASKSQTS